MDGYFIVLFSIKYSDVQSVNVLNQSDKSPNETVQIISELTTHSVNQLLTEGTTCSINQRVYQVNNSSI